MTSASGSVAVRFALWRMQAMARLGDDRNKRVSFQNLLIRYLDFDSLQLVLREVFLHRDYAFVSSAPQPYIVDCGSNIGAALLFFKQLYPLARILAFEPDPQTFTILQQNVAANRLTEVDLRNVALTAQPGPVDFFRDAHRNGALYMSTDDRIVRSVSRDGTCQKTSVEGVCLSGCIDQPVDFLKLDTEGAEHAILADLARQGKLELIRQMVMEFHHFPEASMLPETLNLLKDNGFVYRVRANMAENGNPAALQTLLIRAWRRQ